MPKIAEKSDSTEPKRQNESTRERVLEAAPQASASFNVPPSTTKSSMPWLVAQPASSSARCGVGGIGCSCARSEVSNLAGPDMPHFVADDAADHRRHFSNGEELRPGR